MGKIQFIFPVSFQVILLILFIFFLNIKVQAGTTTKIYDNGYAVGDLIAPISSAEYICNDKSIGLNLHSDKVLGIKTPKIPSSGYYTNFTFRGGLNSSTQKKYDKVTMKIFYNEYVVTNYSYNICGVNGTPNCNTSNDFSKSLYTGKYQNYRIVLYKWTKLQNGTFLEDIENRVTYKYNYTQIPENVCGYIAPTNNDTQITLPLSTVTDSAYGKDTNGDCLVDDFTGTGYEWENGAFTKYYKGATGTQCAKLVPNGNYIHSLCNGATDTGKKCSDGRSIMRCTNTSYGKTPAIDLAAKCDAPLTAVADGKVVNAISYGCNTYGRLVDIEYSAYKNNKLEKFRIRYQHLNQVNVTVGQNVKAGQVIGTVGDSGTGAGNRPNCNSLITCTGGSKSCPSNTSAKPLYHSHLHLELSKLVSSSWIKVDPCEYMNCKAYMTYDYWTAPGAMENYPWSYAGVSTPTDICDKSQTTYQNYCYTQMKWIK